ncbi:MAG: sulfur carrier protein ThiS, partial [Chloroflexi bacterium]|nr:sulfur carrier protein ThiS [Chloroflexota bacterium]
MELIINQQSCEFSGEALDVPTLLASRGISTDAVALALNGEVVPKRKWSTVSFANGDRVDLVKVVAGGAWDDDPLLIDGRSFRS